MVDEPVQDPQNQPDDGNPNRRSLIGLLAVIAVIIILVLMLLLLRSCDSGKKDGGADKGGKEIVAVEGFKAVPGQVSVWVTQGGNVATILTLANLRDAAVTNMGGGRYIVAVPAGTEAAAIKALRSAGGVYDAGEVFSDGSAQGSTTSAPATGK
jgi:ABC-type cobalt transport system substrate-binding protein